VSDSTNYTLDYDTDEKKCSSMVHFISGVRKRGIREDMSPKILTLKNFLSEQYRICDIHWNFQHVFRVSGDFTQTPSGALPRIDPTGDRTPSFVPSETDSWLRP